MKPAIFLYKLFRAVIVPRYRFQALNKLGLCRSMSDEEFIRHLFRYSFGYEINLDTPRTFSEKLHWLNLYCRRPSYTDFADKYKAKQIIGSIIGEKYIIPCLGVWNTFDDIDFDTLPERFILKCNHDSGSYVICKSKKTFNRSSARKKLSRCLQKNHYNLFREWVYKDIKPVIFAEEYLENEAGKGLHDYKLWCFNGKAEYIQYVTGRQDKETYGAFFDREWNMQSFMFDHQLPKEPVPKPERLSELISCAEKLAQGIPFVRVDFYVLEDGTIRFGEMTFFPMAGFQKWKTESMDAVFGDMIHLEGE